MLLTVGILLMIGGAFGGSFRDSNTYMDAVINSHLKNEIRFVQLEPADLPSFKTEFKDKVGFITSNVKTEYTEGKLDGLTNVQRWTDCSAPYYAFGNMTLECPLIIKDLHIVYQGKTKYGKLPTVSIKAKANIPETVLRVEVTSTANRNAPQLKNLRIERMDNVKFDFSGLGSGLNKVLKGLQDSYWDNVSRNLGAIFQYRFSDALSRSVSKLTMPTP